MKWLSKLTKPLSSLPLQVDRVILDGNPAPQTPICKLDKLSLNMDHTQTTPISRRDAVDRARQTWIRKLIDVSRRNNLLYYRPLKTGTLVLSAADPEQMAVLLAGADSVPVGKATSKHKRSGDHDLST